MPIDAVNIYWAGIQAMQRAVRGVGADLPANIATAMDNFHSGLSEDEQKDPKFRYRVAFVPKLSGKASKADLAVEFIKPGTPEAEAVDRVLL